MLVGDFLGRTVHDRAVCVQQALFHRSDFGQLQHFPDLLGWLVRPGVSRPLQLVQQTARPLPAIIPAVLIAIAVPLGHGLCPLICSPAPQQGGYPSGGNLPDFGAVGNREATWATFATTR